MRARAHTHMHAPMPLASNTLFPRKMASSPASSKRWTSASGRSPLGHSRRRSASRSDPPAALSRRLWPSSNSNSSKKSSSSSLSSAPAPTLADHFNSEPLDTTPAPPQSLSRQRSCSDKESDGRRITGKPSKNDGRALGGSMRFFSSASKAGAGVTLTPGRVVPAGDRRRMSNSDADADAASSESERSDASKSSTPRVPKSPSPAAMITRTSSVRLLGSASTQWALSPGRQRPPPPKVAAAAELRGKKSLLSLGWDHLFSRRKAAPAKAEAAPASPPWRAATASSVGGGGEVGHELRVVHGRVMQWRFLNARADAAAQTKLAGVEETLTSTWARVSELRGKVVRKRTQLHKETLHLKLNIILCSQMRALESWSSLESKHSSALASTKDCIQAAVCRLPLTNAAKVSLQSFAAALRQAMDLAVTIRTVVRTFNPKAQDAASLVWELVRVVSDEQAMLQECFELLGLASALQMEEESLRCHLVQCCSLEPPTTRS